jgi:thioredoxin-dependent peroxiredoxin
MENVNVIRTGFMAPDFSLGGINNEMFKLSESLEGNFICLCFFPDGESDKTAFLKELNQELPATAAGLPVRVIGISPTKIGHIKQFKDKMKLNFTLLSDPQLEVASKYYVVNGYSPKPAVYFSVFIIDDTGIVRYRASEVAGVSRFSFEELKSEIPKLL